MNITTSAVLKEVLSMDTHNAAQYSPLTWSEALAKIVCQHEHRKGTSAHLRDAHILNTQKECINKNVS